MSFGNKMWTRREHFDQISGQFFERLDSIYQADISVLSDQNATEQVNDWVKQVTRNKITKLIGQIHDPL